jgi:hypothetical protein
MTNCPSCLSRVKDILLAPCMSARVPDSWHSTPPIPETTIATKLYCCPFCGLELTDPLEIEIKKGEVLYELFFACVPAPLNGQQIRQSQKHARKTSR